MRAMPPVNGRAAADCRTKKTVLLTLGIGINSFWSDPSDKELAF